MKKFSILIVLIFGFSVASFAQSRHYNSMTVGMGGGGTAYADGYHANFINPANLMLKMHRPKSTLGFVGGIGANGGGNLFNVSVYNKYLTKGLVIEGEVRENMLNEWFGSNSTNMRQQAGNVSVIPFGFSHRRSNWALSAATRLRVSENIAINKGMMELLTYGLDREIFDSEVPVNFKFDAVALAEISAGFAFQALSIPNLFFAKDVKLYAGVAPKYLYGVYTTGMNFNSTLQIEPATASSPLTINHQFGYDLKTIGDLSRQLQEYETAFNRDRDAEFGDYVNYTGDDIGGAQATGFGMDLGATLEMDISAVPIPLFINKKKILRLSMSITDLGKLTYDQDASSIYAEGNFSYVGAQDGDDFNTFFETLTDSLEKDVYGKFNSKQIDGVTYNLPSMYNFGTSLEMGKLLLALDYGIGFNNSGINSKRSVLNLGAQYKVFGFMPVRIGTRLGGMSSATYSAGLGLDFNNFEFTVGASSVRNSQKNGYAASAAWSGFVFRF